MQEHEGHPVHYAASEVAGNIRMVCGPCTVVVADAPVAEVAAYLLTSPETRRASALASAANERAQHGALPLLSWAVALTATTALLREVIEQNGGPAALLLLDAMAEDLRDRSRPLVTVHERERGAAPADSWRGYA